NGLRGADVDVVLIGSKTCGKPFGFYATDNCGMTYFTIQFQGLNNKNFGDYPDGFAAANSPQPLPVKIPGCAIADDFNHELGDSTEAMLSAALGYRATGTCPAVSGSGLAPAAARTDGIAMTNGRTVAEEFLRNNRDLRRPPAVR
ncbi:MAG TPA: peptidase, partial [Hyphomonadaceae bacterium]|nr:peptidase [Hyphomonadaceae bacterium]